MSIEEAACVRKGEATAAEVKAIVREQRLSALVEDPVPLFDQCNQRMLELKQEAAMQRSKGNHRRKKDGDLLRQLQSEFSLGAVVSVSNAQENATSNGKDLCTPARSRRNAQPLSEISPQLLQPLATDNSDCRSPVIDRLMKQGGTNNVAPMANSALAPVHRVKDKSNQRRSTSHDRNTMKSHSATVPPHGGIGTSTRRSHSASVPPQRVNDENAPRGNSCMVPMVMLRGANGKNTPRANSATVPPLKVDDRRSSSVQGTPRTSVGSRAHTPRSLRLSGQLRQRTPRGDAVWRQLAVASRCDASTSRARRHGQQPSRQQSSRCDTKPAQQGGFMERLQNSNFETSSLSECISSGGTDLLFDALGDCGGSLGRAELVGLLLVLVSHGFPQATGREGELLQELCGTVSTLYEAAEWSCVQGSEQFQELPTRLCEGCVCFTAHAELKRSLSEAPETLQAILEFMCEVDLSDPSLAFAVASFLFNLCRARGEMEGLGASSATLTAGLRKDSLIGLLYSDVLVAADPGSSELATYFRSILCAPSASGAPARAPALLARCAESCPAVGCLVACTLRLLCVVPQHRITLGTTDGFVSAMLSLNDSVPETFQACVQQTLAEVCITTDPLLIGIEDQLGAVGLCVRLMKHPDDQLQLDGAMGLTNLLTASDDVRSLALEAGAWGRCQELLFSESDSVRRAVTEAMCNFTASPEVVEFCACGQGDLELQVFTSFCAAPDRGTQVAATGALAMLARNPEVALRIASGARCQRLLEVFATAEDPDIQHRLASCLNGLFQTPGLPMEVLQLIHSEFLEKLENGSFVSDEAYSLVWSALGNES